MDYEALNRIIDESGLKRSYIAEAIGMSSVAFANRIHGRIRWKADEVAALCKVLNINRRMRGLIFLP